MYRYLDRGRAPVGSLFFACAVFVWGCAAGADTQAEINAHTRASLADPVLLFSSYFGGSADDRAVAIGTDFTGAIYVVGTTESSDLPAALNSRGGLSDVFVMRIYGDYSAVDWVVYLGGSDEDSAEDAFVDSSGTVTVVGQTNSDDFPTNLGVIQRDFGGGTSDGFIARIGATGDLLAATYVGGADVENARAVAADDSYIYVAGLTGSADFPTTNPLYASLQGTRDVFVLKLDHALSSALWSTYLGGANCTNEGASSVAADESGRTWVAGTTQCDDFPITPGVVDEMNTGPSSVDVDSFVSRLSADGQTLEVSSYVGGSDREEGGYLTSHDGTIVVLGYGQSDDFASTPGAFSTDTQNGIDDLWVATLDPSLAAYNYATTWGGTFIDESRDVAALSDGAIAVTGGVYSENGSTSDYPVTTTAVQQEFGGLQDAFVTMLSPAGDTLAYSTFLGGGAIDHAWALATSKDSNLLYVGGATASDDFPVVSPIFQFLAGGNDAFVAVFGEPDQLPVLSFDETDVELDPGHSGVLTLRSGVELQQDLVVAISTTDGSVVSVPNQVTIPAGEGALQLTIFAGTAGGPETVTATPQGASAPAASTTVTVLDTATPGIDPSACSCNVVGRRPMGMRIGVLAGLVLAGVASWRKRRLAF